MAPSAIERLAGFDPIGGSVDEGGVAGERGTAPGRLRYAVLDVFTELPLAGNQLAVFTDGRGLSGERMQRLARELNLSETVFLLPGDGEADVRARIFTPVAELPFAGHPVLGSAALAAAALGRDSLTLQTAAGAVPVVLERRGERTAFARMRQPLPTWEPYAQAELLFGALGIERSSLPVDVYVNGPRHVCVALPGERAVAALRPDQGALLALGALGVSCFAGSGLSWKTRMFAPGLGVAEDPATGSAAGPLAVHLCRHGQLAFGQEIEIRQGEEIGRPSLLYARALGSAEALEAVEVAGCAVLVAAGEFVLG